MDLDKDVLIFRIDPKKSVILKGQAEAWQVDIQSDGVVFSTVFIGLNSEKRALDYLNLVDVAIRNGFKLSYAFKVN